MYSVLFKTILLRNVNEERHKKVKFMLLFAVQPMVIQSPKSDTTTFERHK